MHPRETEPVLDLARHGPFRQQSSLVTLQQPASQIGSHVSRSSGSSSRRSRRGMPGFAGVYQISVVPLASASGGLQAGKCCIRAWPVDGVFRPTCQQGACRLVLAGRRCSATVCGAAVSGRCEFMQLERDPVGGVVHFVDGAIAPCR